MFNIKLEDQDNVKGTVYLSWQAILIEMVNGILTLYESGGLDF